MEKRLGRICLLTFTAVRLISIPCRAEFVTRHIEDFTTKQYCDLVQTTAWWDTIAGEVKMPIFQFPPLDSLSISGFAWDIAVYGTYGFIAADHDGLVVIDIVDPRHPVVAGGQATAGSARDVAIAGNYAYVADYDSGLTVMDIRVPASPFITGRCVTSDLALDIVVAGDFAYVADGDSGLTIVDITDPLLPVIAGRCITPGRAVGITVAGNYAYIADYGSGLTVVDITDPANPLYAGNENFAGYAENVRVSGDYAYVAGGINGLRVVDISDPEDPLLTATCDTDDYAYDVFVNGNDAVVADYTGGVALIDIEDPENPVLGSSRETQGEAYGVCVHGDVVYVTEGSSGLYVMIYHMDCLAISYEPGVGSPVDVCISGDYAYIAAGSNGFQVIDISDHDNLMLVGSCATPGYAVDVCVSGDYAFVATGGGCLAAIDIFDPLSPACIDTFVTDYSVDAVKVSGQLAFIIDAVDRWFWILDVSDPANMVSLSSQFMLWYPYDLDIAGDYAYLAGSGGALRVMDISDTSDPSVVGVCDLPGDDAWSVAVSGDYAYVAAGDSGLQVVDFTNPNDPQVAGEYETPGEATHVSISGYYAFVSIPSYVVMINISDPENPFLWATWPIAGNPEAAVLSGDYLYIAAGDSGLVVKKQYQNDFSVTSSAWGQSISLTPEDKSVVRSKIISVRDPYVLVYLSAQSGPNSIRLDIDDQWYRFDSLGSDLVFRTMHPQLCDGINQVCSYLDIHWRYACAAVDSIVDVPDDQGEWARVYFKRSGFDFVGEAEHLITEYFLYRRIDDVALQSSILSDGRSVNERDVSGQSIPNKQRFIGTYEITKPLRISDSAKSQGALVLDGRCFVTSTAGAMAGLPPGTWEVVGNVPAHQEDQYICLVPTLTDSSETLQYTVYCISAETTSPFVYYFSPPDSGYSVDNITPGVPQRFMVAYNTGSGNQLTWDASPEPDFQYYRVYRGDTEDFVPGPGNLVHETATEGWNDPEYDGWDVHYKITALDYVGNESDAASPTSTTGDDVPSVPKAFALYQNVPNPFNPMTTIRFDLPRAINVKLCVYNVKGELIATLVNQHMMEGRKEIAWSAKDNRGRAVSSGIYFYRLVAGDFVQTKKMVLLR
ncbi:MAG: T9SS type A sorting domain-containing protein [candidate division WOR-3 bacterium]|nr:MAG: T9SS type A sorting domain-containing protein [candidate division WOR-3 bacterium]UCF05601.1 MAG: T9SS type A sorting domain-containing protein [bacterium]